MNKYFLGILALTGLLILGGCHANVAAEGENRGMQSVTSERIDGEAKGAKDISSEIIVTQKVMVKDEIYTSTNNKSDITARCGMMDGEITSTVEASEIPTENNQSNFGIGYGYQFVDENSLDVYMNDKWIRFEK